MSLQGKTILVTGANSGIGKEAAVSLAEMGARLVLLCRTEAKGRAAVKEVSARSGNADVTLISADLLSQKEVRSAAAQFLSNHAKLDVLVNNAGTEYMGYGETAEGIERTMAVNYFAPFLLTNLLLGPLKAAAPSRVVNVSSDAHFSGSLDMSTLEKNHRMGIGGAGAYSRSKLALTLFTFELARRCDGNGVTSNCLHPGVVRTNIWSHAGVFSPLTRFASLFMKSAAEGAKTTVYLASSPDVEKVTGKYFVDCEPRRSSAASNDEHLAKELWDATARITSGAA